ncbi:unnamed protein product [Didymodactylos carnosus]|uniref:Uncharacterized protein n=1 Tax=Didymodactylos carnosus TaxID=1234261 RepID=A0A813SCE1_9BILA|nr:unnamed protein product [Didymodactylos carnosus]CAF3579583.1 unnamed protein product [Didymodactylos carnosus]
MNNLNRYSVESSTSSSSTSSSQSNNKKITFLQRKSKLSFCSTSHIPKSATLDMFNIEDKNKIVPLSCTVATTTTTTTNINKNNDNYQSTQSLNPQSRVMFRTTLNPPIARVSPISRLDVNNTNIKPSMIDLSTKTMKQQQECWMSCEELETIEKRFTDLLEGNQTDTSITSNRAKSCERLRSTSDDDDNNYDIYKDEQCSTNPRKSLIDDYSVKRIVEYHPANVLLNNDTQTVLHHSKQLSHLTKTDNNDFVVSDQDVYIVESSYKSIGSKVYVCKCIVELFITTAERLSKLEDWIFFQRGLPVWLFNTGINPKRLKCLSIVLAEKGSGFPIWQDIITNKSDIKYARDQHITFRLSDQKTLAVLRFTNFQQSKEFFNYYVQLKNDRRHVNLFQSTGKLSSSSVETYQIRSGNNLKNRSASCGAVLNKRVSKSSISNPCCFQHITQIQLADRQLLTTLSRCLPPSIDI